MKWLIALIFIGILVYLASQGIVPQPKATLVDICFYYYPENYGKYPYVQGFWNSANDPTLTISVDGRIKGRHFAFDKLELVNDVGYDGALEVHYKICTTKECKEGYDTIYPFSYSNEYSECMDNCYKYNIPGQCKYASQTPIAYTCDNICRYQGTMSIPLDQLAPDKQYTVTITKVRYYRNGNWYDADKSKYPYIVWVVFYDPADKPWEMICNPGEQKNFRCEGDYKVWDECSEDGKSWTVKRAECVWCGSSCVEKKEGMICPMVMPPQGYECTCIDGECRAIQVEQPQPPPSNETQPSPPAPEKKTIFQLIVEWIDRFKAWLCNTIGLCL